MINLSFFFCCLLINLLRVRFKRDQVETSWKWNILDRQNVSKECIWIELGEKEEGGLARMSKWRTSAEK